MRSLFLSFRRRLFSALFLVLLTASFIVWSQPVQAFSVWELLFRGLQVVQISNLSANQEVKLGAKINEQLIKSRQIRLNRNRALNGYIVAIGERLISASDRPEIPYRFQVVDDENINAFATMGGFVYVNTGLIAAADNEAELAGVIAHEIGHIAGRHAIEQLRDRAIAAGLLSAAGLDTNQAVQIGVELAVSRPSSREDELEADLQGLKMLYRTGYAPGGMLTFFDKLLANGSQPPSFLSTHPATNERLQTISRRLQAENIDPFQGDGLDARKYQQRLERVR
ncbi:MAG: M48 family metallopeptidase [Cyanobacteria bacterium P01_H01_bin.15]